MFKKLFILTIISIILSFSGCSDSSSEPTFTTETISKTLSGQDVYFIFTNTSMTDDAPVSASVSSSSSVSRSSSDTVISLSTLDDDDEEEGIMADIREFNENFSLSQDISRSTVVADSSSSSISPSSDDVDDSGTFYTELYAPTDANDPDDEYYGSDIAATCREVRTYNGVQLSIWVADEEWSDGTITDTMVTAMADEFLEDGDTDDIYEWVTNIYGDPWGTEADSYSNLIASSESEYITILLYDIDDDGSDDGGTVGYYWSKDNILSSSYSGSNERLMFYIDSIMYGNDGSDDIWATTDYWPETIFSTLAHEFQHMIHFYQKQITFNTDYSDTWVNEMCSQVTEDFLASEIDVAGPRGYGSTMTEGVAFAGESCRLNYFNIGNDESFLDWSGTSYDYASSYAFGAFLARNYGGAELFQDIVQRAEADEYAVINAVNSLNGTSKTFEDLLIEWGKAVLNSELYDATYQYNINAAFTSSVDSNDYNLGSINLENYRYAIDDSWYLEGPLIYNKTYDGNKYYPLSYAALEPGTNTYYQAGEDLTGTYSWTVEVPSDVTLTVVTKDYIP